jgi:endo-1,4-beta-mannosidase
LEGQFIVGINYWPRDRGTAWWREFDSSAVERDFSLLSEYRFDIVRIFLLWEEFQPKQSGISTEALNRLVEAAEIAGEMRLELLPTFFTGHMMGINWLPPWMLVGGEGVEKFPVFSQGGVQKAAIRNYYAEREIWEAQKLLIREVTSALQGHPAIWGWDLGNEPSNIVWPPSKDMGRAWVEEMVTELKRRDEVLPVTLGFHQEDLEEDRFLGPDEVARFCDLVSIHISPRHTQWSDGPLDAKVPLFLGLMTRWLADKDIIVGGLGLPTDPLHGLLADSDGEALGAVRLTSEEEQAQYLRDALELLRNHGFAGAMARCFSDYDPSLWSKPPFDRRVHERFFGLFRWDGSPKPAANVMQQLSREGKEGDDPFRIDLNRQEFWTAPREHLSRIYGHFKEMDY